MGDIKRQPPDHRRMSKRELAERLEALHSPSASEHSGKAREKELQTVLHELEVYQIELEMQVRELRESRHELEESHNRYVNLYDFAPVGYVTLSEQGMINEINLTAAGMLGVERQWLLGRSLAPWVMGPDLPLLRAHLKQCRQDGGKVKSMLNILRKDKQLIPVELSTSCTTDPISGMTVYRTAITDLTERRKAEAELDRFFKLSNELICVAGVDGRFKRLNPAWEATLGYNVSELLAHPILDFVHPDDRDATLAEFLRLSREGATTTHFQNRFIKRDRSVVWLSWNAVSSGRIIYFVARDVTLQIQAKETLDNQHSWLKDMMTRLPVPLIVVQAKTGTLVSMSATSGELIKGLPESTPEMSRSESYFADSHGGRLPLEKWPRMRAANGEELNAEPFIWQTPQGAVHVLVSSRNLPAQFDRPAMAVLVAQDVTQLKQVEGSLQNAVEKLKQERELRERFVSTLTHDLRTPLTAAKLNAQLLGLKPTAPLVAQKASDRIIKSIERINNMIGDLLDANRIRAGEKLPMTFAEFDLTQLVKDTLGDLSFIHGSRLVLKAPGPMWGTWSKSGLRRVVENLVSNAVKYGANQKPITVTVAKDASGRTTISVHNFGNPISFEDQTTLFEPFRRAKSTQVASQTGWGLGLTLVKGTVEAHGGEIRLESHAEKGTTFQVLLPTKCFPQT